MILSAPEPGQAGTLVLSGHADVKVGDILVAGIGAATPQGMLVKVTGISYGHGGTTLSTVPATLPEALPDGGEFSETFDGGELESDGVSSDSSGHTSGGEPDAVITKKASTVFSCSSGAEVKVEGRAAVNPTIELSGGWGLSGLHVRFVGKIKASSELEASAEATASCDIGRKTLFKRVLQPIQFAVGPVPVVVVPVISVYVLAEGKVEADISTELHAAVTASAGVQYSDLHGYSPVGDFDKTFGWTAPDPGGSAHLEATISPAINLLFYGAAGPESAFNVGLAANADPEADPWWSLTAPVSLTSKLTISSLELNSPTFTAYARTFTLAEAGDEENQGQILFDEYPEGTTITDQYQDQGVVFDSDVFISGDGANPTSPVLSGQPQFSGPIEGHFVVSGSTEPTTVNLLQLDAGYINDPRSVEIVAQLANGNERVAVADHLGIDQISIAARGIKSFSVHAVADEAAGFAVDNLAFSR